MGNQQGKPLPPEIKKRVKDLENRIKVGQFSNNKQGEKDIEGLLDYWHKNYGGKTKRTSLPSAKEFINKHFNCTTILEKDKCQSRGDSGCMWEPLMEDQNDDKYDPDGLDAKNQKQYEGLCLKASPMSKDEQTPRPASAVLHQLEQERKPKVSAFRVGVPKRIADLKYSYPGAEVGAQPKTRFDIGDRKAQLYRDEAQKLVKDIFQVKKGDITKLEAEKKRERDERERRERAERGETKGGRKTRKRRRKRKSRRKKRKTKRKRRKRKTRKRRKR